MVTGSKAEAVTVQALCWDGRELTFTIAHPAPVSAPDSVLVKVHLAGICSTDLQILQGYMSFQGIPGHEFVGTVHERSSEFQGRRVVGEINFACGQCSYCNRGLRRHCPARSVMGISGANGVFAEFVSVPLANLHLVPEGITDEEAVFTEPLAARRLRSWSRSISTPATKCLSSVMASSALFVPRF